MLRLVARSSPSSRSVQFALKQCAGAALAAPRRGAHHARPAVTKAEDLRQIGTRDIFTEEHDTFRESVRGFFKNNVEPFHAQWEKDGMVSRELWKEAGSHGLLGVMMPEKYGGLGADALYAAITWEEQGYSGLMGPGFALHSCVARRAGRGGAA